MKKTSILFAGLMILALLASISGCSSAQEAQAVLDRYEVTTDWLNLEQVTFTGRSYDPSIPALTIPVKSAVGHYDYDNMPKGNPANPAPTVPSSASNSRTRSNVQYLDGLTSSVGGFSLVEFKYGEGETQPDGSAIFPAVAKYRMSVNIYTDANVPDLFGKWSKMERSAIWFDAYDYASYLERDQGKGTWIRYDVEWDEYIWSILRAGRFDGVFDVKFGLDPIFPQVRVKVSNETDTGTIDFVQSVHWGNIVVTKVDLGGSLENYRDLFPTLGKESTEKISVQTITVADDKASFSSTFGCASKSVGSVSALAGATAGTVYSQTAQQGFVKVNSAVGSVIGTGTAGSTDVTGKVDFDIQPEILLYYQDITVKTVSMYIDHFAGVGYCGVDEQHGVFSRSYVNKAIRGARVNNPYTQVTFEANAYFETTMKPSGQVAISALSKPSMLQTDMVWDASLRGDMGGNLFLGDYQGTIESIVGRLIPDIQAIITIIVVVAVVALAIYIAIQILIRRKIRGR